MTRPNIPFTPDPAQEYRALLERSEALEECLNDLDTRSELRFTGELEALEADLTAMCERMAQLQAMGAALGGHDDR